MLTLDEVREKLKDRNLVKVAKTCGVHYNCLYRFMRGKSSPAYETVQKLVTYIESTSL